jgi:signal recognition particle receptor subunit beta
MSSTKIFKYVNKMDYYHNVSLAYKILFTIPVMVASNKNEFFYIQIIEELYEVYKISQERLNHLAILHIEKKY